MVDGGARQAARPDAQILTAWRIAVTVKAIAALVVAMLLFGGGFYVGRLQPQLSAAKATIKRDDQNVKQESTDAARINLEAKQFEQAPLDPIVAPVVRVQYREAAACVPRAAPTGPVPHGTAAVPAPSVVDSVSGPDIGRPLVLVGHVCDAQVTGLQDYINHVCRVKAP
jgi:hypothetical protein